MARCKNYMVLTFSTPGRAIVGFVFVILSLKTNLERESRLDALAASDCLQNITNAAF